MIDIAPILAFAALIVGPVLAARLMTRGEPVDLPSVVATVLEPLAEEDIQCVTAPVPSGRQSRFRPPSVIAGSVRAGPRASCLRTCH